MTTTVPSAPVTAAPLTTAPVTTAAAGHGTRAVDLVRTVSIDDVPANRRRGGDVRTILSPATVGSTSGFLGTATLLPGEFVTEHWHPYSEEFLFCVDGEITLRLDGKERPLAARSGVLIPVGMRHRLTNTGDVTAFLVFQLGPLAPRPDLGHVDTETLPGATLPGATLPGATLPGGTLPGGTPAGGTLPGEPSR